MVFGRRGSRPFNLEEMADFYRKPSGESYRVSDVNHGENGALVDVHKRTLAPTEDFAVPASAGADEPSAPTGRLRKKRAPKEIGR